MKDIKKMFSGNPELLEHSEVNSLVEYCRELEGLLLEKNIEDNNNKDLLFRELVGDIYRSCRMTLEDDMVSERFNETPRVDFKQTILNLKEYIDEFRRINKIRF
jgi:hypothetical protein